MKAKPKDKDLPLKQPKWDHPNDADVLNMANEIGMDIIHDKKHIWLIKSALRDPLPPSYYAINDPDDKQYFLEIKNQKELENNNALLNNFNIESTPHSVSYNHPKAHDVYVKFHAISKQEQEDEEERYLNSLSSAKAQHRRRGSMKDVIKEINMNKNVKEEEMRISNSEKLKISTMEEAFGFYKSLHGSPDYCDVVPFVIPNERNFNIYSLPWWQVNQYEVMNALDSLEISKDDPLFVHLLWIARMYASEYYQSLPPEWISNTFTVTEEEKTDEIKEVDNDDNNVKEVKNERKMTFSHQKWKYDQNILHHPSLDYYKYLLVYHRKELASQYCLTPRDYSPFLFIQKPNKKGELFLYEYSFQKQEKILKEKVVPSFSFSKKPLSSPVLPISIINTSISPSSSPNPSPVTIKPLLEGRKKPSALRLSLSEVNNEISFNSTPTHTNVAIPQTPVNKLMKHLKEVDLRLSSEEIKQFAREIAVPFDEDSEVKNEYLHIIEKALREKLDDGWLFLSSPEKVSHYFNYISRKSTIQHPRVEKYKNIVNKMKKDKKFAEQQERMENRAQKLTHTIRRKGERKRSLYTDSSGLTNLQDPYNSPLSSSLSSLSDVYTTMSHDEKLEKYQKVMDDVLNFYIAQMGHFHHVSERHFMESKLFPDMKIKNIPSEYIRKAAIYLHVNPYRDLKLLWIVKVALLTTLPPLWDFTGSNIKIHCNGNHPSCIHRLGICNNNSNSGKYHKHAESGLCLRAHPSDIYFLNLIESERKKLKESVHFFSYVSENAHDENNLYHDVSSEEFLSIKDSLGEHFSLNVKSNKLTKSNKDRIESYNFLKKTDEEGEENEEIFVPSHLNLKLPLPSPASFKGQGTDNFENKATSEQEFRKKTYSVHMMYEGGNKEAEVLEEKDDDETVDDETVELEDRKNGKSSQYDGKTIKHDLGHQHRYPPTNVLRFEEENKINYPLHLKHREELDNENEEDEKHNTTGITVKKGGGYVLNNKNNNILNTRKRNVAADTDSDNNKIKKRSTREAHVEVEIKKDKEKTKFPSINYKESNTGLILNGMQRKMERHGKFIVKNEADNKILNSHDNNNEEEKKEENEIEKTDKEQSQNNQKIYTFQKELYTPLLLRCRWEKTV